MGINITRDAYRMHTKSFMRVFFLFSCVSHLRWTKFRGWKRKKEIRTERERKRKERWCERENKIRAVCRRVAGFECRMWTVIKSGRTDSRVFHPERVERKVSNESFYWDLREDLLLLLVWVVTIGELSILQCTVNNTTTNTTNWQNSKQNRKRMMFDE